MTNEEIISNFLQTAYTDEKLAALLAHAEDGKLSFWSCCCVAGAATATHALQGKSVGSNPHWRRPKWNDQQYRVSDAFSVLGSSDAERRERIIPLIRAEMARREAERNSELSKPELSHTV